MNNKEKNIYLPPKAILDSVKVKSYDEFYREAIYNLLEF